MADLVKLKTGTIAKLEQGISEVPLDKGSVYFAVDTTNHIGQIVYDAPNDNSVDRIVMSTRAEYADTAGGPLATTSQAGFISASDKAKLDGIAPGAQVNSITGVKGNAESSYRTGNVNITKANIGLGNVENKSSATIRSELTSSNVTTALGYSPATQSVATTSANGLMSTDDKIKLDGIANNATNTTISATAPINANASTGAVTLTHSTSGPSSTGNTSKGDTTNQTPAFGDTFKVTSETVDKFGHTTALAEHTVTIPNSIATTSANGLMSLSDKAKLDGISNNAEVNQNAFSNIKVGSTTVAADAKTDTLELAGSNVTLTPDATNDKVTIGITKANVVTALGYTPPTTNTTYENATTSASGLMSASDKVKLDGIEEGAQVNTVTGVKGSAETDYRTGNINITKANIGLGNVENKSSATIRSEITSSNVTTALGYTPATQDVATTSVKGLMSLTDKVKLDGIAEGATNTTISATAPIAASASTGVVTLTHATSGPSSTADTSKGDTSNQTPGWGATFKVTSGTVDKFGHTKTFAEHTVKIPNAVATTSAAGLMSAADKTKIDGGINIAGNAVAIGSSITADTLRTSLGLSNVMHFIGIATVAITDGSTTNPTISGYDFGTNGANAKTGDVIIDKDSAYEYVWTGSKWERLGPDSSYALSDHTHDVATTSAAGFMSAADKTKLDGIATGATANTGTVTSVRVQATSPVVSSVNTAQSATLNTTISLADGYGDTKNPYASKTARYVLAAPAAAAGAPTFRALTNADVGLGNVENTKLSTWTGSNKITTIGTLSAGTVPWARLSGIPDTFTPNSHSHGNITNDGKIGTTADQAIFTTTNGALTAVNASIARTKLGLGTLATKSTISNHSVITPTGATTRTADVALNTTTVNSITAVGTLPSLTVTATDVVTGGTTTDIPNITKKTVVTGVTKKTVVTGGSTTDVPNITKKTVVTSATAAKATYANGVLTISDGSVTTGDSVTVGTAIKAYTSLTTGDSVTVTTGDSVTVGTAIKAYTTLNTSSIGSASEWSAGTLPTKGSNTTVATSVKTQPTFSVTTQSTSLSHTID